ncbi:hypothetical protein ISN76_01385 [Dyella halodurans]|uniref:Uncharacterized protein n=1 Tax=Dyella halodurans TaxID=1920171 RepID=A0ABV9BZ12_9GAMM|nr:hypothetical protein [Dyella halodurans]
MALELLPLPEVPEAAPAADACLLFAVDAVVDDEPGVEPDLVEVDDEVDVDGAVFVDVPVIVTGMELRSALIVMFTQAFSGGPPGLSAGRARS